MTTPVAVITGCSTGIGYATALRLARDGFRVVATMRTPSACDLADIATAEALPIEVRALDVTDASAVDALMAELVAADGVDVLVNNAGVGGRSDSVENVTLDDYRDVMETNFFAAMQCTKAVLPSMRERGSGWIVNVTSQAGCLAMPSMSPYCASKWALEAASESLAVEVAPFGVRVALIEPGTIMTAIWKKVDMTPPTGPYAPMRNRLASTVMAEIPNASTGDDVAATISEAISTDTPRLRWLTGQGAERNIANRGAWTDEEWIGVWNQPDDAAFLAQMLADPKTVGG